MILKNHRFYPILAQKPPLEAAFQKSFPQFSPILFPQSSTLQIRRPPQKNLRRAYRYIIQLPFFLDVLPLITSFSLSDLIILSTVAIEYLVLLARSSRVILLFFLIAASTVCSLSDKFNPSLIPSFNPSVIPSTTSSSGYGNTTLMLRGKI